MMFRLEGSGAKRALPCYGGAQWVDAAKVGSPCALLQKGGGRRSAARRLVSARTVKAGRVRRSGGTPEPSEQKTICSAGMCLRKGKRVNEPANERTHNEPLCDAFPVVVRKESQPRNEVFSLCGPPFAGASRRAWRSRRWAGIRG